MSNEIKICVVGLGYVGLPLASLFATKYPVVGFDINKDRIKELNLGVDSTLEIADNVLKSVLVKNKLTSNGLQCTDQLEMLKNCNYYIITVPTPVDKHNRPILTPLLKGVSNTSTPSDLSLEICFI